MYESAVAIDSTGQDGDPTAETVELDVVVPAEVGGDVPVALNVPVPVEVASGVSVGLDEPVPVGPSEGVRVLLSDMTPMGAPEGMMKAISKLVREEVGDGEPAEPDDGDRVLLPEP